MAEIIEAFKIAAAGMITLPLLWAFLMYSIQPYKRPWSERPARRLGRAFDAAGLSKQTRPTRPNRPRAKTRKIRNQPCKSK